MQDRNIITITFPAGEKLICPRITYSKLLVGEQLFLLSYSCTIDLAEKIMKDNQLQQRTDYEIINQ